MSSASASVTPNSGTSFLLTVDGLFESAWTEIKADVSALVADAKSALEGGIDQFLTVAAPLAINAVLGQWALAIPGAAKFGQAVVDVIMQLEANAVPWALEQVHSLVQNAYNWICTKLGLGAQAPATA